MKPTERELLDRVDAHLRGLVKLPAILRQVVREAFRLIDGESWLEAAMLGQSLADYVNDIVGREVERLHEFPIKVSQGPRSVDKRAAEMRRQ